MLVRFPKIDKFDNQIVVEHDVVGLEVEVDNVVVSHEAESLDDCIDEIELGAEAHRLHIAPHILIQVLELDVVHHYCIAVGIRFVLYDVVFG